MITGKLYDYLKWIAQILLPALGTLYFTLAGIWNLGSAEEVVGTVMAVDLFLGVILGISQINYNKAVESGGEVFITPDGQKTFNLEEMDIDSLDEKKEVRFTVKKVDQAAGTAP